MYGGPLISGTGLGVFEIEYAFSSVMKFVSLKSSLSVMSFIRVVTSVSAKGQASLSASVSVRAAADF